MNLVQLKEAFYDTFEDTWKHQNHPEGPVQSSNPVWNGRVTQCRNSLYTLVKILKPRQILEFGSWKYDASNHMARAMDSYAGSPEENYLLTYDIAKGGYTNDSASLNTLHPRVRPRWRYPHHSTFDDWKYNSPIIAHPEFKDLGDEDIFKINLRKLKSETPPHKFDMIVIDADHSEFGIKKDIEYAHAVSNYDTLICVDDIYEDRNPDCRKVFDNLGFNKVEFTEWSNDRSKPLISVAVFQFQ
jgi:predicted O-methyltransferase YrrM